MHSIISPIFFVYGFLLLLGGAFGYAKAKSAPSLIAGTVLATLEVFAGVFAPHHPRSGVGLGTLVALALTIIFIQRYRTTKNPMPAVPMTAISLIVFVLGMADLLTTHAF